MALLQGVVNVTDPSTGYPVTQTNTAAQNTTNLQNLVNAMLTAGGPTNGKGGTLQFPSNSSTGNPLTYQFDGPITVGTFGSPPGAVPYSLIFMGTGQGQEDVPILEQTTNNDLFIIETNDGADKDIGGTVFQDLLIKYTGTGETSPPTPQDSAIRVKKKSQSVRLDRVTLVDWPRALFLAESYRCSMTHCTIHNRAGSPPPGVNYPTIGVQLGDAGSSAAAIETYIADCLFLDDSNIGTAMQIYGCEHARVTSVRMEGWQQGILITPAAGTGSARKLYFANVSCFPNSLTTAAGSALVITTAGNSTDPKYVCQATFAECEFEPPAAGTTWNGDGVTVGSSSMGITDAIDQIRFIGCHVCLWNGPGLDILGAAPPALNPSPTNVEVIGGYFSCNGQASATYRAGIVVTGTVSGVRIVGAACNNSFYNFNLSPPAYETPTQKYGVYVNRGAKNVRVQDCDLTGNTTNGAYVDGTIAAPGDIFIAHCDFTNLANPLGVVAPVSNLQLLGCPGYNDQGTVITTAAPTLNTPLTIAQLGSTPYYGPGECYVNNAGGIHINGKAAHMTSGSVYLQPLETIQIDTSVSNFLAIGK